ncbi:hypothetical protein ACFLU5_14485 [Bacteroidota bacterium]
MSSRKLLFLCLLFIVNQSFGQGDVFERQYAEGKEYFDMGNYNFAMTTFKPLTLETNNTSLAPYSAFFYALSAYKIGYNYLSKDMFVQLLKRFPDWENNNEVRLWLGKLYYKEESYEDAIEILGQIDDDEIIEKADQLSMSILSSQLEFDELSILNKRFPENPNVGEILADKIITMPFYMQDRALLNQVVEKCGLDPVKYSLFHTRPSVKKESYNIAVLFPFMHQDIIPNRVRRNNQFVLDLYQGLLFAAHDLEDEGISVNVFAYDTRRDKDTTVALLNSDEILSMDLFIGPLYPETVRECADFSFKYGINMINPLSTNSELIGSNPYSFLYFPMLERQANAAAKFIKQRADNKNTFIFYGTSTKDSVLAYNYKAQIEKDSFDINLMQKITGLDTISIFNTLTKKYSLKDTMEIEKYDSLMSTVAEDSTIQTEFFFIEPDSIGHVFVASSKELLGASAISGVETLNDTILIIGNEDWLNFKSVSLEQYERMDIALVAPTFIDIDNPNLEFINETITSINHSPPTRYHYIGYELMSFVGRMLYKHGNLFQYGLQDEGFLAGRIFTGFNYEGSNDNRIVPIIEFVDGEFKITNSIFNEEILDYE